MTHTTTQTCQTCNKLEHLTQENLALKTEITRLTRILIQYENPHTPPSRRLYKIKPTTQQPKNQKRYPGRPKNHIGTTRQKTKTPTQIITPPQKKTNCNHCGSTLTQTHITHHYIEEIPNRQHRQIIDYPTSTTNAPTATTKKPLYTPTAHPQAYLEKTPKPKPYF